MSNIDRHELMSTDIMSTDVARADIMSTDVSCLDVARIRDMSSDTSVDTSPHARAATSCMRSASALMHERQHLQT